MLESVARWFEVDTATSKVTCVDLMRANPFDVLIASERLSDGSGLELLSHVATRWPDTLRVLVIEPARLKLLRGKLAPFRLHATMRYPIEEDELETVLNRMGELMGQAEAEAAEEPEPEPEPPPPQAPPTVTTKVQKVTLPQQAATHSSPSTQGPGAGGPGHGGSGDRRSADRGSAPARSGQAGSGQAGFGQAGSAQGGSARAGLAGSGQGGFGQAGSAQAGSARAGLAGSGQGGFGQAGSVQGGSARSPSASASGSPSVLPPGSRPRSPSPPSSAPKATSRSAKAAPPLGAPLPPDRPTVRRKLGNYTPLGAPEDEQMRIVEREFDQTAAPLAARAIRAREEATRPRSQKEKLGTLAGSLSDTLKRLLKR